MAQETMKTETVQAVDRALQILEIIGRVNSMSLAELNKEIKVNKASLSRLVYTLVQNGYLAKNEKNGDYSLTLKTYEVGLNAVQNLDKLSLINSTLIDLNNRCGRIAQFSVEDNDQLLCLQSIGKEAMNFSVYTSIGHRSPLYSTSAGKALLSAYSNGEIIEKWNNMNIQPLTENTLTDLQLLLQDIGLTRQRGYALDREENEYHVFCIGTVIMDFSNKPIGAISISGRSLTEQEEEELSSLLLTSSRKLSNLLGYAVR
ncbi:IclR family transcriptional regulator [Lacrimispora sp.]|uniref:IclR family transcriptional regulator n=1 Tax=Lacrimispora sp. TaxID=2719234 RepID=UPI00345FA3CD